MTRSILLLPILAAGLAAGPALAGPKCTGNGDKLSEAKVQEQFKGMGYEIARWKVDGGGCYEIYGTLNGKKVETYIDPWTGGKVKEEVKG